MKKNPNPHREPAPSPPPTSLQRRRLLRQGAGLALLGGLGLAGCGGGSGDASSADASVTPAAAADAMKHPLGIDSGGTGRIKSYLSAAIDAITPLTVDGVPLDTSASTVTDADDQPLPLSSLRPGMTCQVDASGALAAGMLPQAQTVRVGEQLLGPVTAVDAVARSITALGQRVAVTSGTLFDAALTGGLAAVQPGMVVRIWGQLDSAGSRIVATRVGLAADDATYIVRGVLGSLDRSSATVRIGGLAAVAADGDASVIAADAAVGSVVRVRLSPGAVGTSAVLLALRTDALQLPDRVEAEVEGRVTRYDTAQRFAVDGVEVDATAAAASSTAAPVALGSRASVRGRSLGGVLLATSVKVEPDEPVELEGTIMLADAVRHAFVVRGTTVFWSASTVFIGGTAKQIAVRRQAAVVGRWNADRSAIEATRVHLDD